MKKELRLAAPDECSEIDRLRARRRPFTERLSYLNAHGTESAETEQLVRQLADIDADIARHHSQARLKLATAANKAQTTALETVASTLNVLAVDASPQQRTRRKALETYQRRLHQIEAKEDQLFSDLGKAADDADAAAKQGRDDAEAAAKFGFQPVGPCIVAEVI